MAVNEAKQSPIPGRSGIQSVHRALDLVEHIGRTGEMGASELARELGLAVSTAHNLLRTLAQRNYVLATNGRYRLGPMATVLTSQWDAIAGLAPLLQPELNRLSDRTGQFSTARVLVGRTAQQVAYELGPGPVTIREPQSNWPRAITVPTGRILAAFTRPSEWPEFIEDACGTRTGSQATRWHDELQATISSGVCARRGSETHGQIAIAVPVWAHGRTVVCSIGCAAPTALADNSVADEMLNALWDVTTDLSARLGCTPLPLPRPNLAERWEDERLERH